MLALQNPFMILLLGGILILIACLPKPPKDGKGLQRIPCLPEIWGLAALIFLVVSRWPATTFNRFLDEDENLVLAGVMRLSHAPIFWKDFDGYSAGPINYYLPLAFKGLTGSMDFISLHFLGSILIGVALYLAVKAAGGDWIPKLIASSAAIIFGTAYHNTFHSYASELPSMVLFAGAAILLFSEKRSAAQNIGLGILLGLVPFAKLQGVPIALAMGAIAVWQELQKKKWNSTGTLIAAGAAPTVILLGLSLAFGFFDEFWQRYIVNNFTYTQQTPGLVKAPFGLMTPLPLWFYTGVGLLIGTLMQKPSVLKKRKILESVIILLAALYTVKAPGNPFIHYAFYLVVPWLLLLSFIIEESTTNKLGSKTGLTAFCLICLLWPFPKSTNWSNIQARQFQPSAAYALKESLKIQPGETLGVWGLAQNYYIEWEAIPFSRENTSGNLTLEWPHVEKMRAAYQKEMESAPPTYYVEAVGPGLYFKDRATHGVQTWPWLESYLQTHYSLIQDGNKVRVWKKK